MHKDARIIEMHSEDTLCKQALNRLFSALLNTVIFNYITVRIIVLKMSDMNINSFIRYTLYYNNFNNNNNTVYRCDFLSSIKK